MDITVIIASIVVFLAITFVLVGMLLGVKARLMPSGPVKLFINGETDVEAGKKIKTKKKKNKEEGR
jgi:Na+-transporting NADH:ubiquinone oxidoreductase subunit F